ncbi:MAG TPA: M48 family metalloprotease [Vicinamibacterales bacterium]|nr:M48 family metalloprotease [Vicinamibacterales bacterium]
MQVTGASGVVSAATSPVAFSETIAPTAISASYRLGLVLVTIAMILVPLLYLLLIGAVAWFLVWHLTANTWILSSGSGAQWRLLGYLTPALAGATLLFFMVKPILARRVRRGDPIQVTDAEQPALHALIREICHQVRAPLPSRVQVDCMVNASATLRGGGIVGRQLDLTIGLPLVTGLSVRELSGVLAHEFGHFAQGGGMRMTALIRGINLWLYRVVHERDTWDSKLEEWSKEGDWRVVIPMALARLSVWASRQALAAVTMVGHGVSCYMLRQMEFDADSYEIKIAGTNAFTRTMVRLRELSAGSQMAYSRLKQSLDNRAIPEDLPLLFAEFSRRLPDGIRERVQNVPDDPTGTFDTHPSDADRVAAAQVMAASGALVGGDEPATILFRAFDRLSAVVTRHHYEDDLGLELDGIRLVAADEALRGAEDQRRTETAVRNFFNGRVSVTRPLRILVDDVATMEVADLDKALEESRAAMNASSVSDESYRAFEHYQVRRDLAFCAEHLFLAGLPTVDAERFSLAEPTLDGAQSTQSWAQQEQDKLRADLDPFDALVARRLAIGALVLDRRQRSDDARALTLAVNALAEAVPFTVDARRSTMAMVFLDEATPVLGTSPQLRARMASLAAAVNECRTRAFEILGQATIPGGESGDAWQRLLADAPQLAPHDVLQRLMELYWGCLSQLARLVSQAEASTAA